MKTLPLTAWDEYSWEHGVGRFYREIEHASGAVELVLVMEIPQPLNAVFYD